jgi:hypothetical protein
MPPKNGKGKMHNKLMRAKEVYKSAPSVGKAKNDGKTNVKKNMKPIDSQLMQMRERQMGQRKVNVAGKAAEKVKPIVLQPSVLSSFQTDPIQTEPVLSLTDLLLQGEANKPIKNTQTGPQTSIDITYDSNKKTNMFADLSDDSDDDNSKYQLKLQPSSLSSLNFQNNRIQRDDDDDDL